MALSDTQVLIALVVALFPAVMALMLGTALADS
jgi:photosystem I reaction center subunit XII